jgi:hypothetical protein
VKKLLLLLVSTIGILGQSALTYTGNFQWTYGQTNMNFKLYAALGTNTFSVLSLITNKTSSITSNLPANVDNRFYVNAVDPKTGLSRCKETWLRIE